MANEPTNTEFLMEGTFSQMSTPYKAPQSYVEFPSESDENEVYKKNETEGGQKEEIKDTTLSLSLLPLSGRLRHKKTRLALTSVRCYQPDSELLETTCYTASDSTGSQRVTTVCHEDKNGEKAGPVVLPVQRTSPLIKFTIISRYPLLSLICKDGASSPTLIVYAELQSEDEIEVENFSLPPGHALLEQSEIQLGQHLLQQTSEADFQNAGNEYLAKGILSPVISVRIRRPRLSCEDQGTVEIAFRHVDYKFLIKSLPRWAQERSEPVLRKSTSSPLCLLNVSYPVHTNDGPRYLYQKLSQIQQNSESYFFGCVVEVSRSVGPLKIPNLPSLSVLNIEVVDSSISASLRTALLPGNTARASVMLMAPHPESLPMPACGDIVRVHRTRFTVNQDFKTGNAFLNMRTVPHITSIRIWSIDDLSSRIDAATQKAFEDPISFQKAVAPSWKSKHVGHDQNWLDEKNVPLGSYDWKEICSLASWVLQSFSWSSVFCNSYYSTLDKLAFQEVGYYADVLVQVLDIDDLMTYGECSENDSSPKGFQRTDQLPRSKNTFQTDSNISFLSGRENINHSLNSRFRVLVTDGTCDSSIHWILSNFSNYAVPYFRKHLELGDFIRVKNVCFAGVTCVSRPSKLLTNCNQSSAEFFLLDSFKSKVSKVPSVASQTRTLGLRPKD